MKENEEKKVEQELEPQSSLKDGVGGWSQKYTVGLGAGLKRKLPVELDLEPHSPLGWGGWSQKYTAWSESCGPHSNSRGRSLPPSPVLSVHYLLLTKIPVWVLYCSATVMGMGLRVSESPSLRVSPMRLPSPRNFSLFEKTKILR